MIEKHPFGSFCPPNAKYLILGSFTTKEAYDDNKKKDYVWFYSNGGRNHFWPMLEEIYKTPLKTRKQMENLLTKLKISMTDIIKSCERKKVSNLDVHLSNIVYAVSDVENILAKNRVGRIYFTSKFVEHKFKTNFKDLIEKYPMVELVTLPSPSPRYVLITKNEKLRIYRKYLPKT